MTQVRFFVVVFDELAALFRCKYCNCSMSGLIKQLQVFGRTSVVVWCNYYSSCWVRLLQMNNCSCLMDCSVEQLQLIHEAIAAIRGIDR